MHSANMKRGTGFLQAAFLVNSVQFAYVCARIIFLQDKIMNLGGAVFLAFTFIDFIIIFATIIGTLVQGSEAN